MRNRILIVAILLWPSALLAQSGHRTSSAPARSTFRGSSSAARWTSTAPRSIQATVSHVVVAARSRSVPFSPTARANAIQGLATAGLNSRFAAPRGQSGRGWSHRFDKLTFQGKRSFGARRADDPQPPAQTPVYIPPYDYTPGALIRTEGLGYTATPTNDAHWANNDPGYAIVQDPNQALLLNPFVGVHVGPKDRLPPPSPGTGSGALRGSLPMHVFHRSSR